jgi:hypothetical protein
MRFARCGVYAAWCAVLISSSVIAKVDLKLPQHDADVYLAK